MENELLKGLYDCFYTRRSFPNRRTKWRSATKH